MFLVWSLFSALLLLSSSGVFVLWLSIELSSLFYISILSENMPNGYALSSVAFKYFLVQGLGSSMMFVSLFLFKLEGLAYWVLLYAGVMINVGLFPFHSWVMHLSSNVDLVSFYLLCTLQKLPPLLGVTYVTPHDSWGVLICSVSSLFVAWVVISSLSLVHLFAVSSLVITSWGLASSLAGSLGSLGFLLATYFIHLGAALSSLSSSDNGGGLSALYSSTNKKSLSLFSGMWIISLMGMPPWGVFLANVEIGSLLLSSNESSILSLLLFSSVVVIYAYVNVSLSVIHGDNLLPLKEGSWLVLLGVLGSSLLVMWKFT